MKINIETNIFAVLVLSQLIRLLLFLLLSTPMNANPCSLSHGGLCTLHYRRAYTTRHPKEKYLQTERHIYAILQQAFAFAKLSIVNFDIHIIYSAQAGINLNKQIKCYLYIIVDYCLLRSWSLYGIFHRTHYIIIIFYRQRNA